MLRPIGVQAALHAIDQRAQDENAKRRQLELALEQARFEAARAQRQFDAVDPGNRLVAAELERRWNERLAQVSQRQAEIEVLDTHAVPSLTPQQRDDLLALGADLPRVWSHPAAGNEVRKRILRCVIMEIVARVADAQIMLIIHWQGGGHTWTEMRVRSFRGDHQIAVYKAGEREARGELTLEQAAEALATSKMTVLRMIGAGVLQATQACKGAPWVIRAVDVQRPEVRAAITMPANRPQTDDPRQIPLNIQ
jgi:excisionase family DNA binding protein